MNINKSNYESWFLDYYEGNLSALQVAELFLFIEQNSSFKTEFELFNPVKLTPSKDEIFEAKEELKRNVITISNIDYYLIGELENELNLQEKIKLKDFRKLHPELEKDRSLYKKVILQEGKEVFQGKKELKKKVILPFYNQFNFWGAAAAIVLLVLGVLYINRSEDKRQTAESNKVNSIIKNDSVKTESTINTTESNITFPPNRVIPASSLADQKSTPLTNENKKQLIHEVPPIKILEAEKNNKQLKKQSPVHLEKNKIDDADLADKAINEPLLMANRIEKIVIDYPVTEINMEKIAIDYSSARLTIKRQTLNEKFEELKDVAANRLNQTTGQEILYNREQLADESSNHIPFKSRMVKLFSWAIDKVSGSRVQMKTNFDKDGNLAAYEITAGKLKLEHGF